MLYGLRQACTYRPFTCDEDGECERDRMPRYEPDELAVVFDEVWEEERQAGPRQDLVDEFMKFAAKLAKKEADAAVCRALGDHVKRRSWAWRTVF